MAKKEKEKKQVNVIDLKIADASDDELKAILEARKKYSDDERSTLIKGLLYVANVDGDYSEFEKQVVESTACTLGINQKKLEALSVEIKDRTMADLFATTKSKKFKEEFFAELISLSYIKGYQTQSEDDELRKIAGIMGIPEKKAEAMLENMYFAAQGIERKAGASSAAAKVGLTVGAVLVGAAIVAVTAGAAAPAIGAVLGNAAGLYGAAATAHGLALLGGGALAAGGGGVAAGTAVIVTAGGIIGAGTGALSASVAGNIVNAHDKKQLKAYVIKEMKEKKTEQEITENLIKAIELQKERITALEKANASQRDIQHAEETVENLISQKDSISEIFGKSNGKK
ncbi:MAG: TerB family tellurite resistance protein [Bacillota bacterium]|nr:TerB family tellurite resistance protein [Bacillota bacterium]